MPTSKRVTRVKICGLTSAKSAESAEQAGADAIGLVFYERSSRFVSDLGLAREICSAVGPFVTTVGLFVDASRDYIDTLLQSVPLQLLQFHGEESEDTCQSFGRPYIKALRMNPEHDVAQLAATYPSALGLLLDAYRPGVPGGTGETFDWRRIPQSLPLPLILAGGLNQGNVATAVTQVQPWAVDVSGGVESAPGQKSVDLMVGFVAQAKSIKIPSKVGKFSD